MSDKKHGGASPMPDQASEPIVAFYLTQETDLPVRFQGEYQVVTIKIPNSSGKPVKKPALRVTFSKDQSIHELVGLVGFGSDPRCHVLLPANIVSSVHCRVFAQLNSGPRVWLVDDSSTQGTQVEDDETSRDKLVKIVHGRRQATQGLYVIKIGPYSFQVQAPVCNTEVRRREDWFRLNKPVPVTSSMLSRQLDGRESDWLRMDLVGKGGFGGVYRYMERYTALYVAIKEEELMRPEDRVKVKKEVDYMKTLRHPFLVDIIFSDCNENIPTPIQYTAMPLYLGNLWDLLLKDPDKQAKERIVVQIFEGVSHMHKNQVLHRDLKPDNIFWVTESPTVVKVGDYGLATSLADPFTLFETCGTAAYMAPEVFQKNILQTKAVDVFSLGATVFAILEPKIVVQGWYRRGSQQYNRVFENVVNSPPKLYAGLVQSMMAPNPEDRPSLDVCIEVVKGQHYKWTKGTRLAPVRTAAAPVAAIQDDTQRTVNVAKPLQIPLDRARAWEIKGSLKPLKPIAQARQPESRQNPQKAPAVQAPKPSKSALVHGVNFQDGLPSYEEATSKNPFARLVDSREIAKKRHRSKLSPLQIIAGPVAEQRANPVPQQSKKPNKKHVSIHGVPSTSRINAAVQPHVSATDGWRSASHSASLTRTRGQQPRNSRQILRRSREHGINIHRAHDAGIRRRREQQDRQAARNGRVADLKRGVYDVAKGYCVFYSALFGLALEGVVIGSERILRMMFKDNPGAREALEHAVPSMNANAQLTASVQMHSREAAPSDGRTASRRQRDFRVHTDEEIIGRQLVLPRRR